MGDSALEILVVEDNPGDARLIAEAFKEAHAPHRLVQVSDGEEAISYLKSRLQYPKSKRPALILLDLNLPKRHGREVLAEIKSNPQLRCIPVVVFTSSQSPEDISQAYNLCANCYVPKPADLERFLEVVKIIQEFWLNTVQLPVL